MKLRIRGPAGQAPITLPSTATVGDLLAQISKQTLLSNFDLKYGYPPKSLSLEDYDSKDSLLNIGVKLDGEQLIVSKTTAATNNRTPSVREISKPLSSGIDAVTTDESVIPSSFSFAGVGTSPKPPAQKQPNTKADRQPPFESMDAPELPMVSHSSTLVLRVMPDDNSCLFRAFSTAFFGTGIDSMQELRSIIAQQIQSHPEMYSAVVLERDPDDYCKWIQKEDAWGGAIELDILSRHFEIEICSIDVQTLRRDRFNEGRPTRCILVYSGIHYDTIALSPSDAPHDHAYAPPEFDTKIFDAADPVLLEGAVDLCRTLQSRHYYTDPAAFSVKCNICGKSCVGEKGATEHAKETGHYDFGEAV